MKNKSFIWVGSLALTLMMGNISSSAQAQEPATNHSATPIPPPKPGPKPPAPPAPAPKPPAPPAPVPAPPPKPGPIPPPPGPVPPPKPVCKPILGIDALQDVHFQATDAGVCLLNIDHWDQGSRDDWGRDHRRGDGRFVDFDVQPRCDAYNTCAASFYNPGPQPSDAGTTSTQVLNASQPITIAAQPGAQTTAGFTLQNPQQLITKTYQLVNQNAVTCLRPGQERPIFENARGWGTEVETHEDCSVTKTEVRLDRGVPGLALDTLIPQIWSENDVVQLQKTYSTDITVNVLPVDFRDPIQINGTLSHEQGQAAQFSARTKYFSHNGVLVSENQDSELHGTQTLNIVSTLVPIAPPSNITVAYDGRGTLTLQDADIAELAHIDPANETDYKLAAYVNWDKVFGHEKFGDVLAGRPEALNRNSNQSNVTINLEPALLANANFSRILKDGSKTWAIYLEITPVRTNKYLVAPNSVTPTTVVYEIKMNKKFTVHSISSWNDPSKYK